MYLEFGFGQRVQAISIRTDTHLVDQLAELTIENRKLIDKNRVLEDINNALRRRLVPSEMFGTRPDPQAPEVRINT